jgi:DNA-binding Lrp family transcriptional regulator
MKLDKKDEAILAILRKNARTSNVSIAGKVGLTEGAVRNRVDRLLREGIITRFTVDVTTGSRFGVVMVKAKGDTKKMMRAKAA